MLHRVFDIKYDTDGQKIDLPTELFLDVEDESDPEDELCDMISDNTGFCHFGFNFEKVPSTFSFGDTPETLIKAAANSQCPKGYPMTIKGQHEWSAIAQAVNQGIDSHLEAITERSAFDASTGECLVHPNELHVLLRRFYEDGGDEAWSLRGDILGTLGIEEV